MQLMFLAIALTSIIAPVLGDRFFITNFFFKHVPGFNQALISFNMALGTGPDHTDTQLCHGSRVSPAKNGLASFQFQPCEDTNAPYASSISKMRDGRWHFNGSTTSVFGGFIFPPGSQSTFEGGLPNVGPWGPIEYQQLTVAGGAFKTSPLRPLPN